MKTICCGLCPLKEGLKFFSFCDLVFDNIQLALVFICLAFPSWLPEEYRNAKIFPDEANSTFAVPETSSINVAAEAETSFNLFLSGIGFMFCLGSTISLFYWLFTGTREAATQKLKKWLCVRLIFLTFLIMITIYKLSTHKYYAFDGFIEVFKIYSVYEILMVKSFIDMHQSDTPILLKDRI